MKTIFKKIFDLHHWYDEESKSGPGSGLSQTRAVRKFLSDLLVQLQASTILDIPCGDFYWMKEVDLADCNYCGADIVDDIINQNKIMYINRRRKFIVADLTTSRLPVADLILCRDCLVHFSYEDIRKALANIQNSECKYLLTTTFPGRINKDIRTGEWRPIDLEASPFFLRKPLRLFNENCTEGHGQYKDKSLALWQIDRIYPSDHDYA
jgi:hypothetical protein